MDAGIPNFAHRPLNCWVRELGGNRSDVASKGPRRQHERQGDSPPGLIAQNYRNLLLNERPLVHPLPSDRQIVLESTSPFPAGRSITAMTFIVPPQRGQSRGSTS